MSPRHSTPPLATPLLAALFLVLAAGSVRAADDEKSNLFISPAGEPFIAKVSAPYPIVDWFKKVDTNGDGRIDPTEFRADSERFFKLLDRNHDGVLTSEEIYIYEHQIVPEILNRGMSALPSGLIRVSMQTDDPPINYDHSGSRIEAEQAQAEQDGTAPRQANPEGAAFFSLFNEPEPVMAADRNFDFKITLKEFLDLADRHFAKLDPKDKGYLTLSDLPQTPAEVYFKARRVIASAKR